MRRFGTAVLLLGCALAGCESDDRVPVVLLISNQSTAIPEIDVLVELDGDTIVDGTFFLSGPDSPPQHYWVRHELQWPVGRHHLVASTVVDGVVAYEQDIDVSSGWFYVLEFYYPKPPQREPTPPQWRLTISDSEPVFQ